MFYLGLTTWCVLAGGASFAGDMNLKEAVKLLETTGSMVPVTSKDLKERARGELPDAAETYRKQLLAFSVVAASGVPEAATALIPYLNYPALGYEPFSPIEHRRPVREDIKVTRSHWPAFSALLDMPGASKVLAEYALNKEKPVNFRLAVFQVLRALEDQTEFLAVSEKLHVEFASANPAFNRWLDQVGSGVARFRGVPLAENLLQQENKSPNEK